MRNGISKYVLISGLLLVANIVMAEYKVKVTPLVHEVKDLSQRTSKILDQNGERCALIKFETPLGDEIKFSFGAQQAEHRELKDDEVWIWVSADVKKITIRCTNCSPLKDYRVSLKPGNVYSAKITTGLPQETSAYQNVNFYCEHVPYSISIDGGAPVTCNEERFTDTLSIGKHDVLIQARLYKAYSSQFRVLRSRAYNDTITMEPNYGEILVSTSQPECIVRVDEEDYQAGGAIKIEPGYHNVTVIKDRYERFEKSVEVRVGERTEVVATLVPAFALFVIQPAEEETEIWVDDKFRGHNVREVELRWGEHTIEGRRAGYDTWEYPQHDFNAKSPRTIRIPKLNRQYGSIRFSFFPTDANVYVDGQEVMSTNGSYSDLHVPTGPHFVQIRKTDYRAIRDSFTVVQGHPFIRDYQLEHVPHGIVSISTEDSIAIYRWNEIDKEQYFVGRGEYNGKLPVGRNRITLENLDGVACQYNMFVNEGTNNPPARFLFTRKLLIRTNTFGKPKVKLVSDRGTYEIKANKKVKVTPQKYKMYISKDGYETYTDSIDMSAPYVTKRVYYAQLRHEGDTVQKENAPRRSSSRLLQRYYDNAGTWFIGIVDLGYTFSFVDTAHILHFGAVPFRYKMLGVSPLDFEVRVTGHASDSVVKTFCYVPKISLVLPCAEGFGFTLYGAMAVNLYDAFGAPNPATGKKNIRTHIIGGASMLINGAGKVPVNIFGEYRWPIKGETPPTEHREQLFRVGINIAIGIDR